MRLSMKAALPGGLCLSHPFKLLLGRFLIPAYSALQNAGTDIGKAVGSALHIGAVSACPRMFGRRPCPGTVAGMAGIIIVI